MPKTAVDRKRVIRAALAGNPNSGKTTIFNALTGAHQTVGNWPGVTVERKEGRFVYQGHEVRVVDLPGTYSLTAYSLDEEIAHSYLVNEQPDVVVAVVDASNLERSLYLVVQLLEMGARVILDLNMLDIAEARGLMIDTAALARILGVRVATTIARKGEGIEELRQLLHDSAALPRHPGLKIDYGLEIESELLLLTDLLAPLYREPGIRLRWLALRLLEGDAEEWHHLAATPAAESARKLVEESRARLPARLGRDIEAVITERRYAYLNGLVQECVRRRPGSISEPTVTDRIDRILTHRWLGIPIFIGLMLLAFQLVFRIGNPLAGLVDQLFQLLGRGIGLLLSSLAAPEWLRSLFVDGIISGIGAVLVFVPNIALLFLVISLLEDSGYMARAAFVMDRFMHALGLHGKSFIPLMMGFGCCVPAILATRTLESPRDRILTILIVPLMSCSARLPIYTLFAGAFFPTRQGLVVFSLYLMGILLAVIVARVFRNLLFREEAAPLIMELPQYQLPAIRPLLRHIGFRTWLFVRKAGTIIAGAVVVLWLLANLPPGTGYASQSTILGRIGSLLAPLLVPAGFGFWQAAAALLAGIVAKELVVGTLGTLAGGGSIQEFLRAQFQPAAAYAFMVMSLIYVPCVATIAAIRREIGGRWAALAAGYSLILGWLAATAVYQLGRLLG